MVEAIVAEGTQIRRRSADLRRRQVLDAAEDCFRRFGFHNASMAQIAAAAAMSVGHVYRYMPNKEAIVAAIVQRDAAKALGDIAELEQTCDCNPQALRSAMLSYVRRVCDRLSDPAWAALHLEIMAEAARNPPVAQMIRDGFSEVQARTLNLMRNAMQGNLPEAQVRRRLDVLHLIFAGLPMIAVKTPDFDREPALALAVDCIAAMLGYTGCAETAAGPLDADQNVDPPA